MIKKLDKLQGRDIYEKTALAKINEVIDVVNELKLSVKHILEERESGIKVYEEARDMYNKALADKYAEQRKWVGKLCKFWDDSDKPENCVYDILCNIFDQTHHEDCPFQCGNGEWYEYCEPVKPNDNVIYNGDKTIIF